MKKYYNEQKLDSIGITFDTDWAPDFILEGIINELKKHDVKTTWFATNPSKVLLDAERNGLVEIGVHPNFFEGSTHGSTIDEVLATVMEWFPKAIGMRSHGLFQSSNMLRKLSSYGIKYESNLLLYDHAHLRAFNTFYEVVRVPYCWSDASHILDQRSISLDQVYLNQPGLKVLDFHPMLLHLNSPSYGNYNQLKADFPNLLDLTPTETGPFIFKEQGLYNLFEKLIKVIKKEKIQTYFLSELYNDFIKE